MAHPIALTAPTALGLSRAPFHEAFHTDGRQWSTTVTERSDRNPPHSAVGELERTRRELAASLALARPGSPARGPKQAKIAAIDAELAARDTRPA